MRRLTCYYSGRVQGIGFRYTAHNLALQYDVAGFVRNLSDGRVEMVMEGPEEEMRRLMEDIRQRMDDFIREVSVVESAATGEFQRFSIKH